MKQILFILCLLTCTLIQTSNRPTQSVHDYQFLKKVNFYIKYGTLSEAYQTLQVLQSVHTTTHEQLAINSCLLQEEASKFEDADNRTNQIISTMPELYQAWVDKSIAFGNYHQLASNEASIGKDLCDIDHLQQLMRIRIARLQLRAERRKFSSEKEQQSYEDQKQTERFASIQKSMALQAEKHELKRAQKLAKEQTHSRMQAERTAHKAQKLREQQESVELQAMAFPKPTEPAPVSEQQRKEQSEFDKMKAAEKIREQAENDAMQRADQESRRAFFAPQKLIVQTRTIKSFLKKKSNQKQSKKNTQHQQTLQNVENFTREATHKMKSIHHDIELLLNIFELQDNPFNNRVVILEDRKICNIENALEKIKRKIDNDTDLFNTYKSSPEMCICIQSLNLLHKNYKNAQWANAQALREFDRRKTVILFEQAIHPDQRSAFFASNEFKEQFKKLGALALKYPNNFEIQNEYLTISKEFNCCKNDEYAATESLYIAQVLQKIEFTQQLIDPAPSKTTHDENGDFQEMGITPACTIS